MFGQQQQRRGGMGGMGGGGGGAARPDLPPGVPLSLLWENSTVLSTAMWAATQYNAGRLNLTSLRHALQVTAREAMAAKASGRAPAGSAASSGDEDEFGSGGSDDDGIEYLYSATGRRMGYGAQRF